MLEEMQAIYNPWIVLQQPAHASSGTNASFRSLLGAIDQGWQVMEPVTVLPGAFTDLWTYRFDLTHLNCGQFYRIFVPDVEEVERFIEQNHFQVIEGAWE